MDKIVTASGAEFNTDMVAVIQSPAQAFISIVGAELMTVVQTFSDPAETERLTYEGQELTGFVHLVAIAPEVGRVRLTLTRE